MYQEEPVLSEFIAAGDEINLALLLIDFKEFTTAGDRDLARRAVFSNMMAKHGLRDRREAMLSHEVSALVAKRPIMTKLFDYDELSAMCKLRVTPSFVDRFLAAKRNNPALGLPDIIALGVRASEHYQWGQYWQE